MRWKIIAASSFIATILAANYVTTKYGVWPVGFGLTATSGTYFAGLAFVLRDALQDLSSKLWVAGAVVVGAGLSLAVGAPGIALASAAAFLLSELADWGIYTPLRKRGYIRAAVASNVAGTLVDTAVFLALAAPTLRQFNPGFRVQDAFLGQIVGKLAVTGAVVLLVLGARLAFHRRRLVAA